MEEGIVTVDGESHPVGAPFLVIATQNPVEQAGTYKLPEAQLDRFLIKTSLGYPDSKTAVSLLMDSATRARASLVSPIIKSDSIIAMADLAAEVFVDESVMQYLSDIVDATRHHKDVNLGVSMRGAMALARAVKTWAITQGRVYATPDDVRELAPYVLAHRLMLDPESEFAGVKESDVIDRILLDIEPPAYRAA
jgi:MoxR-like ATPase